MPVQTRRAARRAVDGVLVLDKPVGMSSTQALQRASRLFAAARAGHTGTLDPLASGVLPICFGAATKLAQAGLDAGKRYLAALAFGVTTTTGDLEGEPVRNQPTPIGRDALVAACAGFVGTISQTPPMHSALKHEGVPLYQLARAGIAVERAPRRVTIEHIDVVDGADDRWTIDVRCSKGTYIRTLAESIGEALGCGAHLAGLCRTASGSFTIDSAVGLEAIEAMPLSERDRLLLPSDALVRAWPPVALDADDAGRLVTGLRRRTALADCGHVRIYGPAGRGRSFLGIGHIAGGELIPDRLLSPDEIARAAADSPTS